MTLSNSFSLWAKERNLPVGAQKAGDGIRTCDLLITSQLLYQLSYTSVGIRLYQRSPVDVSP